MHWLGSGAELNPDDSAAWEHTDRFRLALSDEPGAEIRGRHTALLAKVGAALRQRAKVPQLHVVYGAMAAKGNKLPGANQAYLAQHRSPQRVLLLQHMHCMQPALVSVQVHRAHLCDAESRGTACYHAKVVALAYVVYDDITRGRAALLAPGLPLSRRGRRMLFMVAVLAGIFYMSAHAVPVRRRCNAQSLPLAGAALAHRRWCHLSQLDGMTSSWPSHPSTTLAVSALCQLSEQVNS